ncbi:MAG TPA: 4Fe-4S cluster-binding domain-containing protein, partial [Acidimicrobiia bacterium]|nr:4Fe-4S cluster-binding domain-containing protein [Acidimicrobiia bacterium]
MSEPVRVLRFLPATDAEGPGRRAALWVQGCSIRCPGCFNPHSWAFDGGE